MNNELILEIHKLQTVIGLLRQTVKRGEEWPILLVAQLVVDVNHCETTITRHLLAFQDVRSSAEARNAAVQSEETLL